MVILRRVDRLARVTAPYTVAYSDPIVIKAGEVISLGRRDTEWPDFTWCTNAAGTSGWVAEIAFARHGKVGIAARDYSAAELGVQTDELVTVDDEYGGWSWCTNNQGDSGWIPDTHLAK